ncbi:uncharacterized protein LOC132707752 isoform X1 [Cylas formicarius]|uniref:uncharacterized protein LOC132707752 isoform X1 n=1 Tax=Cylas formicarius TaxID=197179 RepID=UPI002958BC9F|nr:uncharacterized protein LOC132707752 isoform X1 [Cylas formicarius]
MNSAILFVALSFLQVCFAYYRGQYVPKSFYVIDKFGHQSDVVFIRNRRDIMDHLPRVRRGDSYASASSHASASASSSSSANAGGGGGYNPGAYGYNPQIVEPNDILNPLQDIIHFVGNHAGGGGGGRGNQAFASSSSSASSGGSGQGYGTGHSGLGSGQQAGYQGPVLFSRFGESEGTGVHVSGQAQGQRGAFSSSSSSIDDKGKIKYSVQSGKY